MICRRFHSSPTKHFTFKVPDLSPSPVDLSGFVLKMFDTLKNYSDRLKDRVERAAARRGEYPDKELSKFFMISGIIAVLVLCIYGVNHHPSY